jgi:tetratricopeptide (TPR) repeat protein
MMKTPGIKRWAAPALAKVAVLVAVLSAALLARPTAAWSAAPEKREMRAREAYAAGQYKEALDLYVKLYAEKLHPTYLRNIGRCYQLLGDPDKAISSFREYLHKAPKLGSSERAEVEGYIHDMEALKAQGGSAKPAATGGAAETAKPVAATNPPPAKMTESAPPPPAVDTTKTETTPPVLIAGPESAGHGNKDESPAFYKRWWFWTAVGVVVVAGAVAAATGVFTRTQNASCESTRSCM